MLNKHIMQIYVPAHWDVNELNFLKWCFTSTECMRSSFVIWRFCILCFRVWFGKLSLWCISYSGLDLKVTNFCINFTFFDLPLWSVVVYVFVCLFFYFPQKNSSVLTGRKKKEWQASNGLVSEIYFGKKGYHHHRSFFNVLVSFWYVL